MKGTGQSENKLSDSMTFSDHLEELRQRILNSIYSKPVSYTHLTLPTTVDV